MAVEESPPIPLSIHGAETVRLAIDGRIEAADAKTQEKTATPMAEQQIITPDEGYLLDSVTVAPIPSNYGLITYNGGILTVS